MPPLNGIEYEFDMDVEFVFCESGSSDGALPTIIVLMNLALWKFFMLKNDLSSESLRWSFVLQEFHFEGHDKG